MYALNNFCKPYTHFCSGYLKTLTVVRLALGCGRCCLAVMFKKEKNAAIEDGTSLSIVINLCRVFRLMRLGTSFIAWSGRGAQASSSC
jgi:hypothetical protein